MGNTYRPSALSDREWAEHDGASTLPCFTSLRRLITSEWAARFLMPSEGAPLGEGLVVASELDGRLFKWKQSGENLGKVPEQLQKVVTALRALKGSPKMNILPPNLLEIFERLLLVATKPQVTLAPVATKPV